jgi:hypothetical protein
MLSPYKTRRVIGMKKQIKIFIVLLLWAGFGPGPLSASETRVDSAGGLTSIIDDETDNGDLFLDGNPAGLVLLSTHDRFDLAGQWSYLNSQPAGPGALQQSFSTDPRLSNDTVIKYQGLMVFPDPHWAFQVAGDFLNLQGQVPSNYFGDTYSTSEYRELIRAAYNSGPFCFGLEVSNNETDDNYDPGLYSQYVGQSSGSNSENKTRVRAGFISTFPENEDKDSARWEVGGVFETTVGADNIDFQGERFYLDSSPFGLQQTTSTTQYYFFGPEVYYELPGRLLLKFYSFVTNDYTQFTQNVSPPTGTFSDLSTFTNSQFQSMNNLGVFRLSFPLSDKVNLKLGGSFEAFLYNISILGTGENVTTSENRQQIDATFGIGLESPDDYTFGLQFITQSYVYDAQAISTNLLTATDYDLYQFALGGEKWLSPQWALRGGLIVEEDVYSQSVNVDILDSSVTAGLGYQDKGMKVDGKFILGPQTGLNGWAYNGLSVDAELQGTFFL